MPMNNLGQSIGFPIADWTSCLQPTKAALVGRCCTAEPIDPDRHAADLHQANCKDLDARIWTYLAYGPFDNQNEYTDWINQQCLGDDPVFYAIIDNDSNKAVGVASYLRLQPEVGVIEVGHINFSPELQKTVAATEAMFLMMNHVFDDLGYRRYEWKCDALNELSRRAASRLGFTYEGIFRQATMYKGRNRDTAWFAMIDQEWPALKQAFVQWLDPGNFGQDGAQKEQLSKLTQAALGEC